MQDLGSGVTHLYRGPNTQGLSLPHSPCNSGAVQTVGKYTRLPSQDLFSTLE